MAAVASICLPGIASAASVTLNGATGQSCTYSGMTIAPDGSVSVSCQTTSGPALVTISAASGSMPVSGTTSVTITRSNTLADLAVNVAATGACTLNGSATVSLTGSTTSATVGVTAGATAGTCTVTLSNPSPSTAGTLGSPSSVAITVGTTTPPPPPPPTGCAAPDPSMVSSSLGGAGSVAMPQLSSGQVLTVPIPAPTANGELQLTYTSFSPPSGATYEISVSKCQGVIDTTVGSCYLKSGNTSETDFFWFGKASPSLGIYDAASANAAGGCWVGDGSTYYMNIRYTFSGGGTKAQAIVWYMMNW